MRSVPPLSCLLVTTRLMMADAYVAPVAFTRSSLQLHVASESSNNNNSVNDSLVDWDWEQVASSAFQDDKRPIILFDGQCNLCNGGVNFALDHDPEGKMFRFTYIISQNICSIDTCLHDPVLLSSI